MALCGSYSESRRDASFGHRSERMKGTYVFTLADDITKRFEINFGMTRRKLVSSLRHLGRN